MTIRGYIKPSIYRPEIQFRVCCTMYLKHFVHAYTHIPTKHYLVFETYSLNKIPNVEAHSGFFTAAATVYSKKRDIHRDAGTGTESKLVVQHSRPRQSELRRSLLNCAAPF